MSRSSSSELSPGCTLVLVVAVGICILGLYWFKDGVQAAYQDHVTVTVRDKWPIPHGQQIKNGLDLVHDGGREEVMQVEDNRVLGAWNSSDTYARIQKGKRYRFFVAGYRRGWTSSYRNVVRIEEELPGLDPPGR